jgi:alkylglycerol monooxygenase
MEQLRSLGWTEESVFIFSIPLVFALIAIEVLIGSLKNQKYYQKEDTLGTLGMLAGNVVIAGLTQTLAFGAMVFVYQFRIFDLTNVLPTWLLIMVAFFAVDLTFYIWHRASHRMRLLWAIHLSHHSSEQMNFVVAFRQPWLAPLFKIPFFSVLPLFGFEPSVIVVVGAVSTFWGVVGHTQIVPRLGFIEWIFNTPSAHRVHHGTNPDYIDKNYANMFIFIDRILGTYAAEKEPVHFGLTTPVNTNNPITITFVEWKSIWADIKTANSWREVARCLFGPPERSASDAENPLMQVQHS